MRPLLLGVLCGAALTAQDSVRVGLNLYLARPQSDTSGYADGHSGWGGGLSLDVPMADGFVLRPRIDVTTYSATRDLPGRFGPPPAPYSGHGAVHMQTVNPSLEGVFYFGGHPGTGPYLGFSLGYLSATFSHGDDYYPPSVQDALSFGLTGGWDLTRHVGVEVRYVSASLASKHDGDPWYDASGARHTSFMAGQLNAGVAFRF